MAGTCTTYDNTATITQTNQSADESVELCVGSDLTVSKTATGTFDREYFWSISKNADQTQVFLAGANPQSYTFTYTVDVNQTGFSDSGWEVHGVITVSNPNDWQAITLTSLSDAVDNGGACTVVAGPYVVPADGSLDVNYSCSFAPSPTATAAPTPPRLPGTLKRPSHPTVQPPVTLTSHWPRIKPPMRRST